MSRFKKILFMVTIFVLLLSAIGRGIAFASSGKAPLSSLIGKTRMVLPAEFIAYHEAVDYGIAGNNTHYIVMASDTEGYFYVYVPFPEGKTAKWVKLYVVDNNAGKAACIYPYRSNQKTVEATTTLGQKCTQTGWESTSIQVLKVTFSQKITASRPIYVRVYINGTGVRVYGVQGGYLK